MLRSIPEEILRKILIFGDIPSLVSLAACSSSYRTYVYWRSPWLWNSIDFGKVRPELAQKLSDDSLASLLSNVNARHVTASLSLMGCTSIQGYGLGPLSCSQSLEVVELRRNREEIESYGATGLNDGFVIGILTSMAPISNGSNGTSGLKLVKFRKQNRERNFYESFSYPICRFYLNLRDSIADQVKQNRIPCRCCNAALVDKIPPEYFRSEAPKSYCTECKAFFCDEKCHNYVMQCSTCLNQRCEECGDVSACSICTHAFCEQCRPTFYCESCDIFHCEECRVPVVCDSCTFHCCSECAWEKFDNCHECGSDQCAECTFMSFCDSCGHTFCAECETLLECQKCHCYSCNECGIVTGEGLFCDQCHNTKRERPQQDDTASQAPKRPRC